LTVRGLTPIDYAEFKKLENSPALIRAHGEPPSTYEEAESRNISLIDATCPIVKRLQDRIRQIYQSFNAREGSILIFGKEDHPEVRSLLGQTENQAFVVREPEDLKKAELRVPVYLFSQTTMKTDSFEAMVEALRKYMTKKGMDPGMYLHVNNTICGQVSSREPHLTEFVKAYDLVFFISGKQSSNGRALYETCRKVNPNTWFISGAEETDKIDLKDISSIGICGATSTPYWQMEGVRDYLYARLKLNFT
jgi:4-hydroxy-3-methylbut-2-enyl diphosphate reductase